MKLHQLYFLIINFISFLIVDETLVKEFMAHGTIIGTLRQSIIKKFPKSIDENRINRKISDEGHTTISYCAEYGMENSFAAMCCTLGSNVNIKIVEKVSRNEMIS